MSEYLIQSETLTALGDKIRSITNESGLLTPAEMVSALDHVTASQSSETTNSDHMEVIMGQSANSNVYRAIDISPPKCTDSASFDDMIQFASQLETYGLGDARFPLCTSLNGTPAQELNDMWVSLELPSCTTIGESRFDGTSISSVVIPVCTSIGNYAFRESGLTSINAPQCQTIGENTFSGCTEMTVVDFPQCQTVGDNAFQDCSAIMSVSLPLCASIGDNAFHGCSVITSASLPLCTSIGDYAFQNCSALEEIHLNTACNFGNNVFEGVLDPDSKTVRLYFDGTTVSSTYGETLFGYNWTRDYLASVYTPESGSGSEAAEGGSNPEDMPIPGLEIYVPADLLSEFRLNWYNGEYALNILPLPENNE